MNLDNLKTGDLIVRQKGPFSTHYLVYIGNLNGVETVAENQSGIGVRYTSLENALDENPIIRFEPFGGTEAQRDLVIPRINKMLGKSYNLIVFNCEHFAKEIATGKGHSKQVRVASNAAMAGGALMLASKNKAIRTAGVVSIIGGIIGHFLQD